MRGRQPPTHYSVCRSAVRNVATSPELGEKKAQTLLSKWNSYLSLRSEVETLGTAALWPSQHYVADVAAAPSAATAVAAITTASPLTSCVHSGSGHEA